MHFLSLPTMQISKVEVQPSGMQQVNVSFMNSNYYSTIKMWHKNCFKLNNYNYSSNNNLDRIGYLINRTTKKTHKILH